MKFIFLYSVLFTSLIVNAQIVKKDTLNVEVINVVKPFDPSVADAFKINRNPQLEQDSIGEHKPFKYTIFSVPVASTFTPKQIGFVGLVKLELKTIYNNFISAGYGNNQTPLVETFIHNAIKKNQDIGVYINYLSSKGGVKNAVLNDAFTDAKLAVYYKQAQDQFDWQIDLGGQLQKYNWYGLSPILKPFDPILLASIHPQQTYNTFNAGSSMIYHHAIFQGGTFEYQYFSDDYSTSENRIFLAPEFKFPIFSDHLSTQLSLDYLDGKFNQAYVNTNPLNYQFLTIAFYPNFELNRANLNLNLGLKVSYSSVSKTPQQSKFYFYPNLMASYKLKANGFTAFAGLTGDLHQNSYSEFANANNFVSPTLNIKRTNQQYKTFVGLKGLTNGVNFQLKVSYQNEKDKALFVSNPVKVISTNNKAYEYGNSFNVVYDNIKTLSLEAEAKVNFSKQLNFGGTFAFNNYNLSSQQEAWNLPQFKADLNANYTLNKWFVKTEVYVVGQRKGQSSHIFSTFTIATPQTVIQTAYVDLNFSGGYNFSDGFTVFARFNNVLNDNYQAFTNYEVQGFQALAGLTYKFDF